MAGLVGTVMALWRYPVKSMQGEELNAGEIRETGLAGDRVFALIDAIDNKVASAKNPRKWPNLFDFRAQLVEPPGPGEPLPPVRITLPDGSSLVTGSADLDQAISTALGRKVSLQSSPPSSPTLEEYWPDMEGMSHRNAVTDEAMSGFFDLAPLHILTTATIDRLRSLYPPGRFEVRRFRPNIVISPPAGNTGLVENDWIGKTLVVGNAVRLQVTGPCGRCVMTTLPQGDLPQDAGILRTALKNNQGQVGVYAGTLKGGWVCRGDRVAVE